jgi:translation initiation factor 2 subunit 2
LETTDRSTAESHSTGSWILLSYGCLANTDPDSVPQESDAKDMFKGLTKKKKKKPKADGEGDGAAEGDEATPAGDGEFDPTALKKKKKKKTVKPADDSAFEAKLAEAGLAEKVEGEDDETNHKAENMLEDGDFEKGTGIWAHDSNQGISYPLLLSRFFTLLHSHHPDLASSGSKSYKIPPPQCLREGNKKTIFANISEICKRMKRSDEHVTQFLFAELGTSGSVDGSKRLVIKGRFQQKQLENILKRYIGA